MALNNYYIDFILLTTTIMRHSHSFKRIILKNTTKGEKYLALTTIIAMIHCIDHILRVDHSGWPFRDGVSPFSYSLITFPLLLSLFISLKGSWYRVIVTALLLIFATLAHIVFEPLRDKYHTWTYGSDMPLRVGEANLLHIHSSLLGICSVAVAILLSVSLAITLMYFIEDTKEY
jgi:hypothetical protein